MAVVDMIIHRDALSHGINICMKKYFEEMYGFLRWTFELQVPANPPNGCIKRVSRSQDIIIIAVCTKVCARVKSIKMCIFRGWNLFSPYLNNQPFVSHNFSRFRMYSSIPISQCSLYIKKPPKYIRLGGEPHLWLCKLWSHFLVEIRRCKAG